MRPPQVGAGRHQQHRAAWLVGGKGRDGGRGCWVEGRRRGLAEVHRRSWAGKRWSGVRGLSGIAVGGRVARAGSTLILVCAYARRGASFAQHTQRFSPRTYEGMYGLRPVSSVSVGLLCGLTCLLFCCLLQPRSSQPSQRSGFWRPTATLRAKITLNSHDRHF